MFDLTSDGPIAWIGLNRPEAHNAIATDDWRMLADLAERAVEQGARAIALRSAHPQSFCAGADLKDLEALTGQPAAQRRMRTEMTEALARLSAVPIAVMAAIDGGCFGAGVALAMACDIRVAGHGARFAIPPARLGIAYPHPDVARLVSLVGPGQASRLLLTGSQIGAEEAQRIGLVEIVGHSAFEIVGALASEVAAGAPSSIATLKTSIARAARPDDAEQDVIFESAFDGPDFIEGLAAMRERRAPVFDR